jgi:hypothetical protein
MADLKIITHTSYTYETSDGREFDNKLDAVQCQAALDNIERINMLSSKFERTFDLDRCYYIHLKDEAQVATFNLMENDSGFAARISEPGYYYYDEVSDEYINVDEEIARLSSIKQRLDSLVK